MKFLKKMSALSLFLSALLTAGSLSAAPALKDVTISVVNFKKCVEQSDLGKNEQTTFEGLKKQLEEVLMEKEKTLTELANKFNDPDYLDSLSPEAENELKHKFRTLNQELNAHQTQYYQALNQANFKIIQKITEEITKAAKHVAEKKGIDLVLNEESGFFYANKLDITPDVIKEMNNSFKKKS